MSIRAHRLPDACIRPRVLVLAGHYLPGFRAGGLVRAIVNLTDALGREFDFRLIARDRDLGSDTPYPSMDGSWTPVRRSTVRYLAPGETTARAISRLLRTESYDMLYLQTFFDWRFGLLPLLLRRLGVTPRVPVLIAPRGQFSPGALALGRRFKQLYIAIVRAFVLRGDEVWQATSTDEERDIRREIDPGDEDGGDLIARATDIAVTTGVPPARASKVAGRLRAVFVSRISPKKNLDGALALLGAVSGDIQLDVYGPIEDERYWADCVQLAESMSDRGLVMRHHGVLAPDEVANVFASHDLFVFPTHGENFGYVIIEALLAGCPCLLSDQTPWRDLAARNAGWDLPLHDTAGFRRVISQCLQAGEAEFALLCEGARNYAVEYLAGDQSVDETRRLLTAVLEGTRPRGA